MYQARKIGKYFSPCLNPQNLFHFQELSALYNYIGREPEPPVLEVWDENTPFLENFTFLVNSV